MGHETSRDLGRVVPHSQWANGGGGLQSPTSQHGDHQNRRTRQGLVYCFIIITHSHKCTHRLIWVGGTVCQKIAMYKALILSHGHFVISAGGGGLSAVRWRTRWCLGFGGGRLQFPIHASIAISRYISYAEEFLIGHKLSFFWPDINTQ